MTEHWVVISVIVFQTFINLYLCNNSMLNKIHNYQRQEKPIYNYTTKVCTNKYKNNNEENNITKNTLFKDRFC